MREIIVIGAGAAGLMAAAFAAEAGCHVTVLEKNEKAGKKIYITGKGRCNFTNTCAPENFFGNVRRSSRFLYSSFYAFTNEDVIAFFEKAGMKVKVERGGRAFPVSDHASDVTGSLLRILGRRGVEIRYGAEVRELLLEDAQAPQDEKRVAGVRLRDASIIKGDAVIVCTGGLSYPTTGSTGDGYRFAEAAGHKVSARYPSLVPLRVEEEQLCRELQGLSLKNVRLRMLQGKKTLCDEQGEMLFTHFGVSGPLVLTASTLLPVGREKGRKNRKESSGQNEAAGQTGSGGIFDTEDLTLHIDLKPALTEKQLDDRLLREIAAAENKQVKNIAGNLYPAKLAPVMLRLCGIDPETRCHSLTRQQREALVKLTKDFPLHVTGTGGFSEAIITRGGVDVKQIRPDTMESKLVRGLFFAGEVLDIDAVTGGFNLQIAWSTGAAAGRGAVGGWAG